MHEVGLFGSAFAGCPGVLVGIATGVALASSDPAARAATLAWLFDLEGAADVCADRLGSSVEVPSGVEWALGGEGAAEAGFHWARASAGAPPLPLKPLKEGGICI